MGDDADGVRLSPMGSAEGTSITSVDRDEYAIYSRPKSPDQPMSSLMTTSCPPSAFLTSDFQWTPSQQQQQQQQQNGTALRGVDECDMRHKSGIYSNDSFSASKPVLSTATTSSTSLFNFTSMTSLPPRPPSFR